MVIRFLIVSFSIALCGCADVTTTPAVAPATFNAVGAPTVDFSVPDMMCEEGCAATVNEILSRQSGAKAVRVDFEARKATVVIELHTFDPHRALAALVDKGFENSQLVGDKSEASFSTTTQEAEPQAATSQ